MLAEGAERHRFGGPARRCRADRDSCSRRARSTATWRSAARSARAKRTCRATGRCDASHERPARAAAQPRRARRLRGRARALDGAAARICTLSDRNTRAGSRRNIAAHYDLGNDFFALLLDESLMYSAAIFEPAATLQKPRSRKIDLICRKLELHARGPPARDRHGLGRLRAARRAATSAAASRPPRSRASSTSSRASACAQRVSPTASRPAARTTAISTGPRYDKLVSIEMIEAIGHEYYDTFFAQVRASCSSPTARCCCRPSRSPTSATSARAARSISSSATSFPGSCIPSVPR